MNARITKTIRFLRTAPMASPAPTTTSSTNRRARGFTLVEILLVLAIIGMVMALGLPAIQRVTYQRVNSTTRKFVGLIRTIRNDAVLLNNIYRLVIDLDRKLYWVESQREQKQLVEDDPQVKKSKKKKGDEPPPNFLFATKYSKKPIPMPDGVALTVYLKNARALLNKVWPISIFSPTALTNRPFCI